MGRTVHSRARVRTDRAGGEQSTQNIGARAEGSTVPELPDQLRGGCPLWKICIPDLADWQIPAAAPGAAAGNSHSHHQGGRGRQSEFGGLGVWGSLPGDDGLAVWDGLDWTGLDWKLARRAAAVVAGKAQTGTGRCTCRRSKKGCPGSEVQGTGWRGGAHGHQVCQGPLSTRYQTVVIWQTRM